MAKDTGKVLIHGKEYETVASRVQKLRDNAGTDVSIITKLIERDEETVVMKASIIDKDGRVIATGHAEENRKASTINRTSALENCETSAIGRALAAFGLAGTEFASADEVAQAISNQGDSKKLPPYQNPEAPATEKQKQLIARKLKEQGVSLDEMDGYIIETYGVETPLTIEGASFVISELIGELHG